MRFFAFILLPAELAHLKRLSSLAGLEKMDKTSIFLKECLRLYPPFSSCFPRVPLEDLELDGTKVNEKVRQFHPHPLGPVVTTTDTLPSIG